MFAHGPPPIFACLAWLVLPGWTVYLMGQMVMGELDALTGIVVIALCFFIGLTMFAPPNALVGSVAVWSIYLTVVLWFPVRKWLERGADRQIFAEGVEMTYDQLNANPNNVIAQFRLARQLAELGKIGFAAALAERVVPGLPRTTFREEHRQAQIWMQQASVKPDSPIPCPNCRAQILPGSVACPACGRAYVIDLANGRNGGGSALRKMLAVWAILLAVIMGLPALAAQGPAIAIPGAILMMGAAVATVYFAFRPAQA